MSNATKIVKELEKASSVKQKSGDEEQAYLTKLVDGIAGLPEEAWNKLSQDAQNWYNAAADAVNDSKPIPTVETVLSSEPEPVEEEKDKPAEEEATTDAAEEEPSGDAAPEEKKDKPATPKAKKPAKDKSAEGGNGRARGVAEAIRTAVCEDPDRTIEEVRKILTDASIEFADSRLVQMYSFTHCVLATLKRLDKLA